MADTDEISYDTYLKLLGMMTLAKEHMRLVDELEGAMARLVGDPEPLGSGAIGDALYGVLEPDPRRAVERVLDMLKLVVAPAPEAVEDG